MPFIGSQPAETALSSGALGADIVTGGNDPWLEPNTSDAEGYLAVDILSNGFRLTHEDNTKFNGSGNTFIYFAWAESPFKYARAN